MRRTLASVVIGTLLIALSGCASGPRQLSRAWDDHVNQKYTENAWLHGALWQDILPIYGIVGLFAAVGDVLFVNPYYFWGNDAWDNRGTGFDHKALQNASKTVSAP